MVGDKENGPIPPLQLFSTPLMTPIKGIITLNGSAAFFPGSLQAELIKATLFYYFYSSVIRKRPQGVSAQSLV